jgi:AmmeMemoRadiSam system protein A
MSNPYTSLARQAISKYLQSKKVISPPKNLPENFTSRRGGVFITLTDRSTKKLRGCMGTYLATKPSLAEEIIANAIAAATTDYRFDPISANELSDSEITVSILGEPQQIKSLQNLDVKKYGVIVKTDAGKSGLLLPDIDSVTTPEEQVAIAAQKGGIQLDNEEVYLYRFTVNKQSE